MDILIGKKKNRPLKKPFRTLPLVLPKTQKGKQLSVSGHAGLAERLSEAIKKTHSYYTDQQHRDGYWWYELESNVTITAEYLMLFHFLELKDEARDWKIARHLLRNQRTDGTWAIHWGGKGDLSTTVEAYFALKLAGLSADDPSLRKARAFILEKGGVEACRVFTKIFLALFGEFDWKAIPSIPVEINLLPHWFPVNIYNFSSWARSTIVPLSIILDIKPYKPLSAHLGVRELYKNPSRMPPLTTQRFTALSWKRFFLVLDTLIKAMEDLPLRPLRKKGLWCAERWICERQEPEGDWGGIQPAMVNSIIALVAMG
ncbi:MAG TPA: prenyltransferase/squalene oxidase repeat-containing protein, partial [Dissulfurispiraceae bacterium]